jgi:hypothetical protein
LYFISEGWTKWRKEREDEMRRGEEERGGERPTVWILTRHPM